MRNARVTFVLTLATISLLTSAASMGLPAPSKSKAVDPKLVSEGHTLFLSNCSPCHGANAQGDDGPNLHHLGLPDDAIASTVTTGIKNEMPPFGQKLKADDLRAVVAYVHSLQ